MAMDKRHMEILDRLDALTAEVRALRAELARGNKATAPKPAEPQKPAPKK